MSLEYGNTKYRVVRKGIFEKKNLGDKYKVYNNTHIYENDKH